MLEISKQTIDDTLQEQAKIEFEREKFIMRIPLLKTENVGLRRLSERSVVTKAMETLRRRAQVKRTMWSRRSQEYNTKINSGDLISIAEVTRDLFRPHRQAEQSYSERQLYEAALDRIVQEIAVIHGISEESALKRIENNLQRAYAPSEVMA
ncbi:MAG: CarD family transcriptional regulator [Hyphomicrobiales bacterium]|nr:CarD family transcriptional regulator [Hyphomicrobiales bacterium]